MYQKQCGHHFVIRTQTCYNIVHLSVTSLLQSIITKAISEATRRKGLIDLCRTR